MTKNIHAVEMGKLGGPARAKALSPERRREIASNAGKAGGRGRPRGYKKELDKA